MTARLTPLTDGWYVWRDRPAGPVAIQVRLDRHADGRLRIAGLRLDGPVSAGALRAVPVGRIEATANAQIHAAAPPRMRRGAGAALPDRLRQTDGRGYPDAFYDAVAAAYRGLAPMTSRPVSELAAANDVPVTTAQRWVKEARRRGLLTPGHPGKAG